MFRREAAGSCGQLTVIAVDGDRRGRPVQLLPGVGATVYYTLVSEPDTVAVPVGAFADPAFPPPVRSVYESRRYAWVTMPADAERHP
jgi:hypothetical protein